jgi:glutathione S-transferase
MALTLIIGNKNYSSWSLRPWIAMKVAGIAFEEKVIPLYEPGSRELILQYCSAGKVPVLIDGDQRIWESLAILEWAFRPFARIAR